MAILLALALLQDDDVDEIIRRLSARSIGGRQRAMDDLVSRGREVIPLMRKVVAKAEGEPLALAKRVIGEIDRDEAKLVLAKAGHENINDLKTVADEGLAKRFPNLSLHVLPTKAGEDGRGEAERAVVVNDLAEKGEARLIAKPEYVVALLASKAENEEDVRALARAALFVLRATKPKAHTDTLVGRSNAPNDPDNWWDAAAYKVEKGDGWKVSGVSMQFGHEWMSIELALDKDGRLSKIVATSTGRS
jgi:hypothetical protein